MLTITILILLWFVVCLWFYAYNSKRVLDVERTNYFLTILFSIILVPLLGLFAIAFKVSWNEFIDKLKEIYFPNDDVFNDGTYD